MINDFAHPRPEYPRPDRQRGLIEGHDWLNLNGAWQFRFDGERVGINEQWFLPEQSDWRQQIVVPFCWESLAAWGEGDSAGNENYYSTRVFRNPLEVNRLNHRTAARYEVGWYRREISIPNNVKWEDKRVILTVGAADFSTECWCNGSYLGQNEGGYTPFEFDLTDDLAINIDGTRSAHIVLRVEDAMDNHEQPVGKQWNGYTTTSGIWQTVFIEPRRATHIASFRVLTHIETKRASFIVHCENAPKCELELEIVRPDGQVFTKTLAVQDGIAEGFVETDPLFLWEPNAPHLYGAVLRLKSSTRLGKTPQLFDEVRTYFGMRKIAAAPTDSNDPNAPLALRINDEPRYLRGALYQSYHPDGVYTAGKAQTLREDIQFAKEAGFNFLRIHIKIDDPLVLYYADTIGMMLMCAFPNFGEGGDTPLGRERFETMMTKAIERDWNHPSIVAWCLFNETWGFGGQVEPIKLFPGALQEESSTRNDNVFADAHADAHENSPGFESPKVVVVETAHNEPTKLDNKSSHQWVQSVWKLAKSLDSTRLIEGMSVVYWDHLDYYGHGDTDINSWHFYIDDYGRAREHIEKVASQTFRGSTQNQAEGFAQGQQPLINSEYGGVGVFDGNRDISWNFRFLTNELRRQGKICAYIYTELHDVEWEYNGFLRYDRTCKEFGYDPLEINSANVLPIDAPPISRHNCGDRVLVSVASSHYAKRERRDVSMRWRLSGIDNLGHIHADLGTGATSITFPHWQVAPAADIELTMPEASMLCNLLVEAISPVGEIIARNGVSFLVSDAYPAARETTADNTLILRGAPADWAISYWPDGQIEREAARAEDLCWSRGRGFFEWSLPLEGMDLRQAKRVRVLVEASSRRDDESQTDCTRTPSTLRVLLNDFRVHQANLANHPFDARGVLSYLRGGKGAYGYMAHATIEGELLQRIAENAHDDHLRLRLEVPPDAEFVGGLTVYGAECGRFPIPPTVVVEW